MPEVFLIQAWVGHVGAGDDQGVQPFFLDAFEGRVVLVDISLRVGAALQARHGKDMHIKLGDLVAVANQAHELAFSDLQRGIRHHIQQANVQLTNILRRRSRKRQHFLAPLAQALETGQISVGD